MGYKLILAAVLCLASVGTTALEVDAPPPPMRPNPYCSADSTRQYGSCGTVYIEICRRMVDDRPLMELCALACEGPNEAGCTPSRRVRVPGDPNKFVPALIDDALIKYGNAHNCGNVSAV